MKSAGAMGRIAIKKKGTANWSEEEINRMLLCLVENKSMKRNASGAEAKEGRVAKRNKGAIWELLAVSVSKEKSVKRSSKACRTKFKVLEEQFKKEVVMCKECGVPSTWPYFEMMSAILPVVTVSSDTKIDVSDVCSSLPSQNPNVLLCASVLDSPSRSTVSEATSKVAFHSDPFLSGVSVPTEFDTPCAFHCCEHDACDCPAAVSPKRLRSSLHGQSSPPSLEAYHDASYYCFSMKYFVHMLSCFVEELQSLSFHSPSFQTELRGIVEGEKVIIRQIETLFLSCPERRESQSH